MPIGPEFKDPDPVPNYSPYFDMLFPYPETTQQLSGKPTNFQITVKDPNLDDQITIRWVANYPLYVQNSTNLIGESPATHIDAVSEVARFTSPDLTCDKFPSSTENNLVVIVSDRGFVDPVKQEAIIPNPGFKYSYKDDRDPITKTGPTQSLVMMGWRITGCM